jgi:hypothetical protein
MQAKPLAPEKDDKPYLSYSVPVSMDLLHRKNEVILTAPTGAAADNIGGNTYHTSLGISIGRSRTASTTRSRIKRLWARKTIMIVDEVSMMDLTMLSMINNHCKTAKSLDRNSPEIFGGLPLIIFQRPLPSPEA